MSSRDGSANELQRLLSPAFVALAALAAEHRLASSLACCFTDPGQLVSSMSSHHTLHFLGLLDSQLLNMPRSTLNDCRTIVGAHAIQIVKAIYLHTLLSHEKNASGLVQMKLVRISGHAPLIQNRSLPQHTNKNHNTRICSPSHSVACSSLHLRPSLASHPPFLRLHDRFISPKRHVDRPQSSEGGNHTWLRTISHQEVVPDPCL